MTSKFITFEPAGTSASGKTKIWEVMSSMFGNSVGQIRWKAHWRKYVFASSERIEYDHICLRALADFCEEETKAHRKK